MWLLRPLWFLDTQVQWTYTMISCISNRSFKCVLCFFTSSWSSGDHLPQLCLDLVSILQYFLQPFTSALCRSGISQPHARSAFPLRCIWLENGTFACTVQLSDKHRCAPFDGPEAEQAIVLLHFILYSSKHLDLLHLFLHWQLRLDFISSCWCFFLALFFCYILVVWVMTEVKSYQHVFFFFSLTV